MQTHPISSTAPSLDSDQAVRANELSRRYENSSPQAILEVAIRHLFPKKIALISSFGAESVLLLHFLAEIDRSVPVLFLDTGKHFDETLMYRDILASRFAFTDLRSIEPDIASIANRDPGGTLWRTNPNLCCQLRKVDPLQNALGSFDAWITGRKRYQSHSRAALPTFESLDGRIKVNPLAQFDATNIEAAFKQFKLPQHPLYYDGFKSIGCKPCTLRVTDGADTRSGRWAGTDKTECGIHR